jgi:membrane protein implicated in regulation of membrane protease activity
MLNMGIAWIIFMSVFSLLAIVDMVFWGNMDTVLLTIDIPAPVASYVGQTFWIQSFSYVFILVLSVVMTYKIVQTTADETDYAEDVSYDSWGFR